MNKIKFLIMMLVLCSATIVKAEFYVPNLAGFDYTPIYDQQATTMSSIDAFGDVIVPLDGNLEPFYANEAGIPSTPSIPGGDGNGTGIIPGPNPIPLGSGFCLLIGIALFAVARAIRVLLKIEKL